MKENGLSHPSLQRCEGKTGHMVWSRKNEEYMADFLLVAKRSLREEEMKLFRYHFLLGADWRLCLKKLGTSRGEFFHVVYRIEQKLGRIFRELEPYALFPLDEYFGSGSRERMDPCVPDPNVVPIRPPLKERPEKEVIETRKVA